MAWVQERLCLLTVHAHPDDEASKGAPTVAKYNAEGVRTVLVCCTGGEEGDIQNPAMDTPEVRERHGRGASRESWPSRPRIIGYDEVVMLGYRDSGMPDTEANNDPRAFAKADFDEAVGRLVAVIRRERPQVIITYGDDQRGYPHPDHLRVHDISRAGLRARRRPRVVSRGGRAVAAAEDVLHDLVSEPEWWPCTSKMLELGLESPYDEKWFERPSQDDRITTRIEVGQWLSVRRDALLAHATQIDPTSPFWFGLSDEVLAELYPWEEWVLARSLVGTPAEGEIEHDLFAGVRSEARESA